MASRPQHRSRPRVVELAGPAGVGKSTVTRALRRRCAAAQGTIWGLPVISLLGNGMQLVPTLCGFWLDSRSLLWAESRHIVRLRTLGRTLAGGPPDAPMLLFDEGPIFALAWLRGFGHECMRRDVTAPWWQMTLREWAGTVDTVVVLDAPDSVLAQRIRARPEWHEVKDASDSDLSLWMARFRSALNWVLDGVSAAGGPVIIRITTDHHQPGYVAEQIVAALDPVSHVH
jgi:predicted ATPase